MSAWYGNRWIIVVGTIGLLALAATTATTVAAHARLIASNPADKAVLSAAPSRITLTFSEETSPTKSGGSVTDAGGATVSTGFAVDLNERTKMTIDLKPNLPNGVYRVTWNSLTEDDNGAASGAFTFTIQAVAGAATAGVAPASSPAIASPATARAAPTIAVTAARSAPAVATGTGSGTTATTPTTLPQTGKRDTGRVPLWLALAALVGGGALTGGIAFRIRTRRS